MIIFRVKINVAIYITQKWGQNLQKMGSGYEHFQKAKFVFFSNIGFIVFKRTSFATPFQRRCCKAGSFEYNKPYI